MNILLVNNDAIVEKLVKLSTQRTGDRLDTAASIDEIREASYDLLILEGDLFSRDFLERLNDRVIYAHSLLITTRESEDTDLFEKHLYKPFLPTELLLMLHQIGTSVEKEHEEASREIIFDDFDDLFISKVGIVGGEDEAEQDALERVQRFEKIEEEPFEEIDADEASEDEVLENIFSEEEVSAVKAILDVLADERPDEKMMAEDLLEAQEEDESDIDRELEAALRNLSEEDLAQSLDDELLLRFDDLSTDDLAWEEPEAKRPSRHLNQESIETLRTLLKALENPQLSKSLRGTITINLTFGEANE